MSYKRLAIIPARSGSKGIRDKNIVDLCGKPLMAYSIEAAINSGMFDRVVVSTDSESYAQIAKEYGADVILRGENLSNDTASSFVVIKDVLEKCDNGYDYFVLLQPTSPIRDARHVEESIKLFERNMDNFDFLVSVKESEHAKVLCNPIEDDLSLKHFDIDYSTYRRQSFKDYSPNGAIFIGKSAEYLQQKHFFGKRAIAYMMSLEDSVDIDNYIDLKLAEIIIKKRCNNL